MFAMKRVLLAVVFMIAISGFAAAQSTSAKPPTKKSQTTTVKKGSAVKPNSKNTVLKQEAVANAKSENATVILVMPKPQTIPDSTTMPKVKNEDF
jgi:hypothetical protein